MSDSDLKVNRNIYPDAVTCDRMSLIGHYVAAFSCCGKQHKIELCPIVNLSNVSKTYLAANVANNYIGLYQIKAAMNAK